MNMRRGYDLVDTGKEEDYELIEDIRGRMILHWNYRNLKEIPLEVLNNGEHIEEIYLKRNCLEKLPPDINKLCNLTNLYLVGNQLECLPPQIGGLKCLRVLDVSQNYMKQLPDSIGELNLLESLLLTYNQLVELPLCIKNLSHLKQLEISGNRIYSIPEEVVQGLESLEELGMDRNPINYIPRNMCMLRNLRYLSACRCNLLYLPSLPFHKLIGGRAQTRHGEQLNKSLQFHFDGNPRLNYLPYWVLQLLGKSVECFGCGLEAGEIDDPNVATTSGQSHMQIYSSHSVANGPTIKLILKNKQQTMHFDEDISHLRNTHHESQESSKQEETIPTLFELCLRQVHHLDLLDNHHTFAVPVEEPLIIPQKANRNSPLSNLRSEMAINMNASAKQTERIEVPTFSSSTSAKIKEDMEYSIHVDSVQNQSTTISKETAQAQLLPQKINILLKTGPVARCFECLRPIFTESWPIIYHLPSPRLFLERENVREENLLRREWDGKVSCCCVHFCGASCSRKFRAENDSSNKNLLRMWNLKCIIDNEIPWKQI